VKRAFNFISFIHFFNKLYLWWAKEQKIDYLRNALVCRGEKRKERARCCASGLDSAAADDFCWAEIQQRREWTQSINQSAARDKLALSK